MYFTYSITPYKETTHRCMESIVNLIGQNNAGQVHITLSELLDIFNEWYNDVPMPQLGWTEGNDSVIVSYYGQVICKITYTQSTNPPSLKWK